MKRLLLVAFILPQLIFAQQNDYIDFDTPDPFPDVPFTLDTSQAGSWAIGDPNKTTFTSAQSAPNAIVTDLTNPYSTNDTSIFIIKDTVYRMYSSGIVWDGYSLTFDHYIDSDSAKDGGRIDVSFDQGNTWNDLFTDTTFGDIKRTSSHIVDGGIIIVDPDTFADGSLGFSGSKGWISTSIVYDFWDHPKYDVSKTPTDIYWRFTFRSDSVAESKDGWMIDNIYRGLIMGPNVPEFAKLEMIRAFPNPTSDILNLEVDPQEQFTATILDSRGSLVKSQALQGNKSISVQELPTGHYYLILYDQQGEGKYYSPFLKQ